MTLPATGPTTGPTMGECVAESLRRHAEALEMGLIRWVVQDHDRDGRPVRAGDRVFLVLQSANRDEGTFAGPDRFDIGRPVKPLHVGFGRGVHACLGAQLACLSFTRARKGRAHAATTRTSAAPGRR